MNLLCIHYDLRTPLRDYKRMHAAIQRLGPCIRPLKSMWYVWTNLDPIQAHTALLRAADQNDGLLVSKADGAVTAWSRLDISDAAFKQFAAAPPLSTPLGQSLYAAALRQRGGAAGGLGGLSGLQQSTTPLGVRTLGRR
jgi:hypothetical protein